MTTNRRNSLDYVHWMSLLENFIFIGNVIEESLASQNRLLILILKREGSVLKIWLYIEDVVINEGEIIRMNKITEMYTTMQKEQGITLQGVTNQALKERLIRRFKGRIDFFIRCATSTDLVYSTSEESIQTRLNTKLKRVKKAAIMIKEEISTFDGPFSSWPPPS